MAARGPPAANSDAVSSDEGAGPPASMPIDATMRAAPTKTFRTYRFNSPKLGRVAVPQSRAVSAIEARGNLAGPRPGTDGHRCLTSSRRGTLRTLSRLSILVLALFLAIAPTFAFAQTSGGSGGSGSGTTSGSSTGTSTTTTTTTADPNANA